MAFTGPRPKPSALRVYGSAINEDEPKPEVTLPPCPEYLDAVAAERWCDLSLELYELGILTNIDSDALAVYCSTYSRWREALANLARTGPLLRNAAGVFYDSPCLNHVRSAEKEMRRMLTEFGMTPSSRTRVVKENKQKAKGIAKRSRA